MPHSCHNGREVELTKSCSPLQTVGISQDFSGKVGKIHVVKISVVFNQVFIQIHFNPEDYDKTFIKSFSPGCSWPR